MERKESEGLALPKGKRRVSWKIEDRPTWWPMVTTYKPEEFDLLISSYSDLPQPLPDSQEWTEVDYTHIDIRFAF